MPEPLLLIIQCKQCGLWINATDGQKPNAPDLLRCGCCAEEHDHDEAAETGQPCRPINITLISPIQLQLGIGQPQSTILADGLDERSGFGAAPELAPDASQGQAGLHRPGPGI